MYPFAYSHGHLGTVLTQILEKMMVNAIIGYARNKEILGD